MKVFDPRRRTCCSCKTRSNFTWKLRLVSEISSKSSVPPLVASNRPGRLLSAPVKAPFSCPKSSLSKIVSGNDPQLMHVNGACYQFLAGSAGPRNEHAGCTWRHPTDGAVNFQHLGTSAYDRRFGRGTFFG